MKSGAANNCAIRSDFATFLAAKCLEDSLILWQNYSQLRNSWLHEFHLSQDTDFFPLPCKLGFCSECV